MGQGTGSGNRGRRGRGFRAGHGIHHRSHFGHGIHHRSHFGRGFGYRRGFRTKSCAGMAGIMMIFFGGFALFSGIMLSTIGNFTVDDGRVNVQGIVVLCFGAILLVSGIVLSCIMHKKDNGLCYSPGTGPSTVVMAQGAIVGNDPNQMITIQQTQAGYYNAQGYYIQPTNQQMNQPMNQQVNQPMNQPINQPINQQMGYGYPGAGPNQTGYTQPMQQQSVNFQVYPPPGGNSVPSAPPQTYPQNYGQNDGTQSTYPPPMYPAGDNQNVPPGMPPPPAYAQVVGQDGYSNADPYKGTNDSDIK